MFDEHNVILIFIMFVGALSIVIVFCTFFLFNSISKMRISYDEMEKRQIELQAMTKKFMDENEEFFIILDQFNDKFDSIIHRQGKLGGILGGIISDNRRHDRRVAYLLSKLGETMPDDFDPKNPGS